MSHEIRTIQCALQLYDSNDLYTSRLANEFKDVKGSTSEERNYNLTKTLYNDPKRTETLYEYCWSQIRKYIKDTAVYSSDVYELLRKEFILE